MGYEISVTPLQLASAYATFANGGELVEPALVKEIIAPDGTVRYQAQAPRRAARRCRSRVGRQDAAHAARRRRRRHRAPGGARQLSCWPARRERRAAPCAATTSPGATIRTSSASFPADNPQYVIVVKLTAPQSSIFAAETAAPVTKVDSAGGDRGTRRGARPGASWPRAWFRRENSDSAKSAGDSAGGCTAPGRRAAPTSRRFVARAHARSVAPFVVTLPLRPQPPAPRAVRAVPDVRGLDLRDAVRSLHSAGFRVQLARGAAADAPAATTPRGGRARADRDAGSIALRLLNARRHRNDRAARSTKPNCSSSGAARCQTLSPASPTTAARVATRIAVRRRSRHGARRSRLSRRRRARGRRPRRSCRTPIAHRRCPRSSSTTVVAPRRSPRAAAYGLAGARAATRRRHGHEREDDDRQHASPSARRRHRSQRVDRNARRVDRQRRRAAATAAVD